MTIQRISSSGEPFPKFLLDHVREQWEGVTIPDLDPDICLKVDSALAYAECDEPNTKVRQFLYVYHESADFDYEVLPLLVRVFGLADSNGDVWSRLVALDFQRDCGLDRESYISELECMIEDLEMARICQPDYISDQLSA
jgi:hypothetical protein